MRAFVAKWGGLILAAMLVLPIAIFGGTYLYANSRVEATLNWVTQEVTMTNFVAVDFFPGETEDSPGYAIYYLTVVVTNRTPDAAEVSLNGIRATMDEYNLEINGADEWHGTVNGNDATVFEGNIILPLDIYDELSSRDSINTEITGGITATTHYMFIDRESSRPISILADITLQPQTTTPAETTTGEPTTT
jgi:hypothetical protein